MVMPGYAPDSCLWSSQLLGTLSASEDPGLSMHCRQGKLTGPGLPLFAAPILVATELTGGT